MKKFKRWILGVCMGINQLANVLAGGDPDEAVSSRVGRAREAGSKPAAIICEFFDWVDLVDNDGPEGDHCEAAVAAHKRRVAAAAEKFEE